MKPTVVFSVVAIALAGTSSAQDAAELAGKLQEPLANLKMSNTESSFDFGTADEELSAMVFG